MNELAKKIASMAALDLGRFNSLPENRWGDLIADAGMIPGSNYSQEETEEIQAEMEAIESLADFNTLDKKVREITPEILIGTRPKGTRPVRGS